MYDRINVQIAAAVLAVVIAGAIAAADLPEYTLELQARTSLSNPYNIPAWTFFTSNTPTLNDNRQVAIKVSPVDGDTDLQGIWFKDGNDWTIGYTTPPDALLSDARMNNHGYVVAPQTFSAQNGVYFYDSLTDTSGFRTNLPFGNTGWTAAQVNDDGVVAYRGNFTSLGNFYYSVDTSGAGETHAVEAGVDPNSPYSFLFTPSLNNNRQIAAKVRLGNAGQFGESQPDHIRIFNADGSSVLIAQDSDSDSSSPFAGFDNSVSLTENGWVAFNATLVAGGRGVFLSDGATLIEIATQNHPNVSNLEFFGPVANENGQVAFRAFDGEGKRAVFIGDGNELKIVLRDGSPIDTDLGPGLIGRPDASPVFGGGPAINNNGDIAINASLVDANNPSASLGTSIIIALAEDTGVFGDLNGDDRVNLADLIILVNSWGPCPKGEECPADLSNNGQVGLIDLLLLINAWTG